MFARGILIVMIVGLDLRYTAAVIKWGRLAR